MREKSTETIHYCSGFWFDKYHLQLVDALWHRAKQLFSHVQVGKRETRRFPSRCRCLACSSAESMWQRILRSRRPLGTAMHANSAGARTHNYACICARADASVRAHLARRWMCLLTRTQQEQHIVWTRSCSPPRKAGDVHKWAVQHVTPLMNEQLSAQPVRAWISLSLERRI